MNITFCFVIHEIKGIQQKEHYLRIPDLQSTMEKIIFTRKQNINDEICIIISIIRHFLDTVKSDMLIDSVFNLVELSNLILYVFYLTLYFLHD